MAIGDESSFTGWRAQIHRALLSVLLLLIPLGSSAAGDLDLTYYGSFEYATGEYLFTQPTNSVYIVNGVALSTGRLQISGDIPVILQNTPWVSFAGGDLIPTGGSQHENVSLKKRGRKVSLADTASTSNAGIGDPQLSMDLTFLEEGVKMPWVDLSAEVKIPVADVDQGFGTGTWDFGSGISLGKWLGENRLSVALTYWILGDLEDLQLKNPLTYRLTWGRSLSDSKYGIQLTASGSTEMIQNADPPVRVSFGIDYEVSPRTDILTDVTVGLTESASDFSISLGWQVGI
jgi:hypothetical protein